MGLLDTLVGRSETATETANKYAILLNAGPDDAPAASNGFNYALEFDDAGYDVQVFLDGQATKWPETFEAEPDLPFSYAWEQLEKRGLLAGACGYCANAFDVVESCQRSGIDLLSDETEHAPKVAALADDGYEMLTIG